MTAPPLGVTDLLRRYGDFIAVDHLSLEVGPGEIVGFLGPNGAGKTTTLRCCSGLLRPDAGEVVIAGASLAKEPARAKAGLGFVPDRPFLYDRLSAREMLELVGALYDVPAPTAQARAEELLSRLGLEEAVDDLIEGYSQGMRQKVAVAAAVLHDPPLLLLDEPLGGLDPHGAKALKDLLRERAARGLGVLVSTHLLEVAERLCDRVVILNRGRRIAAGTLDDLRGASQDTLEDVFLELTRDPSSEKG
jgi:ABC-2 type transport system ATP-binding protein